MEGTELEIKFAVSEPRMFDVILADPQLGALTRGKQPITQSFEALYYDTPNFSLKKAGIGYRIRKEGNDWVATFKSDAGSSGGLFSREEWNEKVSGPETTKNPFAGTFAGERLEKAIGNEQLQLLFSTCFNRTALQLETAEGATIEMAMDRGTIWSGSGGAPICELELELKTGTVSQLLSLAAWVAQRWHLLPESQSKYTRGIQLLQSGVATENDLIKESLENMPEPILTVLVDQRIDKLFVAQSALLKEGTRPENIRALRIQCRQLRSVLNFFQSQLKKDDWQIQIVRLRQWGTMLGMIRDIDVLEKAWDGFVNRFEPIVSFSQQWRNVLSERREFLAEDVYYRLVRSELTQIIFELQAWIYREQEERLSAGEGNDVSAYVRRKLMQETKDLRQQLDSFGATSSIAKMHRLRIKIKRLRYVQESLVVVSQFRSDEFIVGLKQLQSAIGKIHDGFQIKSLLEQAETGNSDTLFQLEKELFISWRSRATTERMFLLPEKFDALRKLSKLQLRTLSSLRMGKRAKLRHDADPHEPNE